jgi:hypothetical protein
MDFHQEPMDDGERVAAMFLPSTIHDILTATWSNASLSGKLTEKQKRWGAAYFSFFDRTDKEPTDADVARELGLSRAASSKMKRRILSLLAPAWDKHMQDMDDDEYLLAIYRLIQKDNLNEPEFLEKRRGEKGYWHWKLSGLDWGEKRSVAQERLGLNLYTGYVGEKIQDRSGFEKLRVIYTTEHKSSPLSDWWNKKICDLAKKGNIHLGEAYRRLHHEIMERWQRAASNKSALAFKDRFCRSCGQLLPLGESIDGRKVTRRRALCSNFCKVQHRRYQQIRKIAKRRTILRKNIKMK